MWELVNKGGIEMDSTINAWNAGSTYDMIKIDDQNILLATSGAGVWLINESSGDSKPLSKDWENTHVTCLAAGPNGAHHFYAGCADDPDFPGWLQGALFETDTSLSTPIIQPWLKIPIPPDVGSIIDIAVLKNRRIIVLACRNGLRWSKIPIPGSGDIYTWEKPGSPGSTGTDIGQFGCSSVTLGPDDTIIVGAWSEDDPTNRGIGVGQFFSLLPSSPPTLYIRPTKIHDWPHIGFPTPEAKMERVTVASCESQPKIVYALCTAPQTSGALGDYNSGRLSAILRSSDGGFNWSLCHYNIDPVPTGNSEFISDYGDNSSGGPMHSISVHPNDPDHVAFGILLPFHSTNGGLSWQRIGPWDSSDPQNKHVHVDIHFIHFDPVIPGNIYIGSDGGLISTKDGGVSFNSIYNKPLFNLHFYGVDRAGFYGKMCVSYIFPNFIGGGLQDNGNVYCELLGQQLKNTPWKKLDPGDGGQMLTIPLNRGDMVIHDYNGGNVSDGYPKFATWNVSEKKLINGKTIPIRATDGTTISDYITFSLMETIPDPQFRNSSGQLMYAVAVAVSAVPKTYERIFGLFADSDGHDLHWETIVSYDWRIAGSGAAGGGPLFKAIGSRSGKRIFLSTKIYTFDRVETKPTIFEDIYGYRSEVFAFTPFENDVSRSTFSPPLPLMPEWTADRGGLTRFAITNDDTISYAVYTFPMFSTEYPLGRSYLYGTSDGGKNWGMIYGGLPKAGPGTDAKQLFFGIAYDDTTTPNPLYVATDKQIFVSIDEGNTWSDFSIGLPNDPHCADLRFVYRKDEGKKFLYLATYGWSVWRIQL